MITLNTINILYRGKRATDSDYDRCFGRIVRRYGWDIVDPVMDILSLDAFKAIEEVKDQLEMKIKNTND